MFFAKTLFFVYNCNMEKKEKNLIVYNVEASGQEIGRTAFSSTVNKVLSAALSENTRHAYGAVLLAFFNWQKKVYGIEAQLPVLVENLAEYLACQAENGVSITSLEQLLAALALLHRRAGITSPTRDTVIADIMKGVRHIYGKPPYKKAAMKKEVLKKIVDSIDRSDIRGKRDAALLLLGWDGAFRRSELAALSVEDIKETVARNGLPAFEILVRRSKTDQEGRGLYKAIFTAHDKNLCPVAALKDYLSSAGITSGAVFRWVYKDNFSIGNKHITGRTVALIVQKRATEAGIYLDFGGHSLRSGFITSAIEAGKQERSIQNQTGHKSLVVLREYFHRDSVLSDNAADDLL